MRQPDGPLRSCSGSCAAFVSLRRAACLAWALETPPGALNVPEYGYGVGQGASACAGLRNVLPE
jgi:hypothetical protein